MKLLNTYDYPASKVLQTVQKEVKRKGLVLSISVQERLPTTVKGDSNNFKQLLIYFANNALKNATTAKVDVNLIRTKDGFSTIELLFQDSGAGMSDAELDVLDPLLPNSWRLLTPFQNAFQEFQQVQDDESWPLPSKTSTAGSHDETETATTTVDVAAIARYVRNANGQIQVKTEIGTGTLFSVELVVENSVSPETRPGKLRNILSSLGSTKGLSPPPFMKPPRPLPYESTKGVDIVEVGGQR